MGESGIRGIVSGLFRANEGRRLSDALMAVLLAVEAGLAVVGASGKLGWYDELLTFHLSGLQPFSRTLEALRAGADGMPPGYYAMVRAFRQLPLDPHLSMRLPSILGYLAALAATYGFARSRLPSAFGVAAGAILVLSPFRYFATEARGYALLTGALAVAAWAWQHSAEGGDGRRRWGALLMGGCLAIAVASHHLAVLSLVAFAAAELVATRLRGWRFHWPVWAAIAAATIPFFWGLPYLLRFGAVFAEGFWAKPGWVTSVYTYSLYLATDWRMVLPLLGVFTLVAGETVVGAWRRGAASGDGFAPAELVLIGGLLSYPAGLALLSRVAGGGYVDRYGWPAVVGLALAMVFFAEKLRGCAPRIGVYLLAVLLGGVTLQAISTVLHLPAAAQDGGARVDPRWVRLAEAARGHEDLPVVVGSAMVFLEVAAYAPPDLRGRVLHLADPTLAIRWSGADTVDRASPLIATYAALRVESPAEFLRGRPRFLLLAGGEFDWMSAYLADSGYPLRLLARDGNNTVYLAGD